MPQDGPQKVPGGRFLRVFTCRRGTRTLMIRFFRVGEAQGGSRRPTHTCFYVFSLRVAEAQGGSR